MSYVLTTAGASVTYPISVANGGTGATTAQNAMITLSSPAFESSASNNSWGTVNVPEPPIADATMNKAAIDAILQALVSLGVLV